MRNILNKKCNKIKRNILKIRIYVYIYRCNKPRTWVQILASVTFFYLFCCALSFSATLAKHWKVQFRLGYAKNSTMLIQIMTYKYTLNTLKLLKALTSTKWGKQKETIVATYKAITRPILEYASTIWSPIASTTGITKLQTIQNMALRIATGCTSDTNIQHLHNETNILPLNAHLKLHSSQLRQKSQHPTHPLHKFTVLTENERHKKQTIFDNNNNYTVNINMKSDLICEDLIQSNLKLIHSHIVSNHLSQRPPNKVLQDQTPSVSPAELLLSRETRRTLAQLRTNKSPLLVSYLFSIGDPRHPSPPCPLCLMHDHTSSHLFECKSLPTSISSLDLWTNPDKVEPFLATWGERLLAAT